jgi:hypothetical protein
MDQHYTQILQTKHYKFLLNVIYRSNKNSFSSIYMYVGEGAYQALSISLPFSNNNDYDPDYEKTVCNLGHIKKFREALVTPVSDEIWNTFSFPSEMLIKVIDVIRTQFPYIKHMTLTDDSQLPCSSNPLDKLDLLYYNVAVHKKTWYEQEFNAYFLPRNQFIEYKCDVESYSSPLTKQTLLWDDLQDEIIKKGTPIVYNKLKSDNTCMELYETSKTFPQFFESFSKMFTREEKCYVFKGWIEPFLQQYIGEIPRNWIIDIYQAKATYTRRNRIRKLHKTHKASRKN